jgi:cytochrome c oxidase subunit 1
MGIGMLVLLGNVIASLRCGERAKADPWHGDGLEWGTQSPPPSYNFLYLPVVMSRHALWSPDYGQAWVEGIRSDRREVLVTRSVDAEPHHREVLPGPSLWPLALALAVGFTFIVGIFTPKAFPMGALLAGVALVGWFWPRDKPKAPAQEQAA